MSKPSGGWNWLIQTRTEHWFDDKGTSLCKRWGTFGSVRNPEPTVNRPCNTCKKLLEKMTKVSK
jgi:hypothetical protein